ncbi:MAG TPA: hypothetical protein VLQ48_02525, partial [Chloroflexia bacterium]|nr:hypothetical protein [Chloroflexia bacterium]
YRSALTKGKQYELLAERDDNVSVRGDNELIRWYPSLCFDLEGNPAPRLSRWKFDDPPDKLPEMLIDVQMQFDDGAYRWSIIATPTSLKNLLEERDMEPGFWASHMIVVRSLNPADISLTLSDLDRQGDLLDASRLLEYEEEQSPDRDGRTYTWYSVGPAKTTP